MIMLNGCIVSSSFLQSVNHPGGFLRRRLELISWAGPQLGGGKPYPDLASELSHIQGLSVAPIGDGAAARFYGSNSYPEVRDVKWTSMELHARANKAYRAQQPACSEGSHGMAGLPCWKLWSMSSRHRRKHEERTVRPHRTQCTQWQQWWEIPTTLTSPTWGLGAWGSDRSQKWSRRWRRSSTHSEASWI